MKVSALFAFVPVLATILELTTVSAVPLEQSFSLAARDIDLASDGLTSLARSDIEELAERTLKDIVHKVMGRKPLTNEQKQQKVEAKWKKAIIKGENDIERLNHGTYGHGLTIHHVGEHATKADKKAVEKRIHGYIKHAAPELGRYAHAKVQTHPQPGGGKHFVAQFGHSPDKMDRHTTTHLL